MSRRRPRGTIQDPMEDYHDTNRPAHRESRPGGHPTKNTTETASNKTTPNQKELHMNNFTVPMPPPAFAPVEDTDGRIMFWDGPNVELVDAALFTEWNPETGVVVRDVQGNVITPGELLRFACKVLQLHSVVLHASRAEVAK